MALISYFPRLALRCSFRILFLVRAFSYLCFKFSMAIYSFMQNNATVKIIAIASAIYNAVIVVTSAFCNFWEFLIDNQRLLGSGGKLQLDIVLALH